MKHTTSPSAAHSPAKHAEPKPGRGSITTRAPRRLATSAEPSVLPLSTTIGRNPGGIRPSTQGRASASFKVGRITSGKSATVRAGGRLGHDERMNSVLNGVSTGCRTVVLTFVTLRRVTVPSLGPAFWVALILAGRLLGERLHDRDPLVRIGAPPLVGTADVHLHMAIIGAMLLAGAAVAWGAALSSALRWRRLLATTWLAGAAWAVALAAADGWHAIVAPLTTRYEYLPAVDRVGGVHSFLSGFVAHLASYPTHVKGHPPGLLLFFWALDRCGLGGPEIAAAFVIAVGAAAGPAVLVTVRRLVDEPTARAGAPFVAFVPAAVWIATSGDALFAGVTAIGIALFAVAATSGARRAATIGAAAGIVLGVALHLSYGVAPMGVPVLAIAIWQRAPRAFVAAAAGVALVTIAFVAEGFWWVDGLDATRALYHQGVAARRPYLDFLVISPAAFALAIGPATAAGLARLRDHRMWVLTAAVLTALLASELSGLSRGETERIWLLFVPWLAVAAASLRTGRAWLAAQLALGLVLQVGVRSPW